jgi:hypothetical protein
MSVAAGCALPFPRRAAPASLTLGKSHGVGAGRPDNPRNEFRRELSGGGNLFYAFNELGKSSRKKPA